MRYLWVGLGGACGSMVRYAIGVRVNQSNFPWATLGINLAGSLVLGLFLTLALVCCQVEALGFWLMVVQ